MRIGRMKGTTTISRLNPGDVFETEPNCLWMKLERPNWKDAPTGMKFFAVRLCDGVITIFFEDAQVRLICGEFREGE